jgi:hypothetical protein
VDITSSTFSSLSSVPTKETSGIGEEISHSSGWCERGWSGSMTRWQGWGYGANFIQRWRSAMTQVHNKDVAVSDDLDWEGGVADRE